VVRVVPVLGRVKQLRRVHLVLLARLRVARARRLHQHVVLVLQVLGRVKELRRVRLVLLARLRVAPARLLHQHVVLVVQVLGRVKELRLVQIVRQIPTHQRRALQMLIVFALEHTKALPEVCNVRRVV